MKRLIYAFVTFLYISPVSAAPSAIGMSVDKYTPGPNELFIGNSGYMLSAPIAEPTSVTIADFKTTKIVQERVPIKCSYNKVSNMHDPSIKETMIAIDRHPAFQTGERAGIWIMCMSERPMKMGNGKDILQVFFDSTKKDQSVGTRIHKAEGMSSTRYHFYSLGDRDAIMYSIGVRR